VPICTRSAASWSELVDSLFAGAATLDSVSMIALANRVSADSGSELEQCLRSGDWRTELDRARQIHRSLKANGTPLIVVGRVYVNHYHPKTGRAIRRIIRAETERR
jgi:protein-disulfide isomerase